MVMAAVIARVGEPPSRASRMIGTGPAGERSAFVHETDQDDVARLLDFLHGRDVPCPICRYNLRDLRQPECPECRHEILLSVGVIKPRFLWFLLAVAPCMFSAIAAGLLLIPMFMQTMAGVAPLQSPVIALEVMGWLSALGGLMLIRHRFAFLRRAPRQQRVFAAAVWFP